MIHGRNLRFSGDAASYKINLQHELQLQLQWAASVYTVQYI